jgi:hypothetical protein
LIEYRSGFISLLSLDARRALTGPYSDDRRRHFSSAPRSHLLNTVVVRTRAQTEHATYSATCPATGSFSRDARQHARSGAIAPRNRAARARHRTPALRPSFCARVL